MSEYQVQYIHNKEESVCSLMAKIAYGVFLLIMLLGCIVRLIVLKMTTQRLTPLFVIRKRRIYQDVSSLGRLLLKQKRQSLSNVSISHKVSALARFLLKALNELLAELEAGATYTTSTHLIKVFERAQRNGQITILNKTKGKRRILIEALTLLGWKDFIRILHAKEHRALLFKQFYKIDFTRNVN